MLHDPRAEGFVTNFTGQWLRLRQIEDTMPDKKLYGKFDELLQVSMVREGEGFFRQLLTEDLPITNFLDSGLGDAQPAARGALWRVGRAWRWPCGR